MISVRLAAAGAWLGLLLAAPPVLGQGPVRGVVFADRNGNGVRDPGEPGLPGVEVSNGTAIVLTDAAGGYRLEPDGDAPWFVIKPRGWRPPVNALNLPQFYRRRPAGATGAATGAFDFPLQESPEPDRFQALVLTDPQPTTEREVGYLAGSIVRGLAGASGAFAFGVTLGDLVSDRPDLYPSLNAAIARVGVPWYNVPGNHDLDLGTPDDRHEFAGFEAVYGPSTYAFHYGPALFIALNDVRFLGGPRYVGGLRPDQLAFIGNLLRLAPREELVVLLMHIPWFYPNPSRVQTFRAADRGRLFALFADRPHVLWLSGHTHYQRNVFHTADDGWTGAQPLHEYNVAAACGGFWGGPPDADGIPVATMADGTPPGYAVLTVDGTAAQTEYRPGRGPADAQIGLYAPRAARARLGYVSYFANVFNGHEGWTIESRLDDRVWNRMQRVIEWDPAYAEAYLAQNRDAEPAPGLRLPDPTVCYHLWRAYLPPDLAAGRHRVEIRATDPAGRVFSAARDLTVTP